MISYNKIIGLPVLVAVSNKEIGSVEDLVIDFGTGRCVGLLLSEGLLQEPRAVLIEGIKEIDEAVVVTADDMVLPLGQLDLFKELLDKKIKIKDNQVVTESGRSLGEVADFELDNVSYKIAKLEVRAGFIKKLFQGKLYIDFDNIISIGKEKIIVKDDLIKEKKKVTVVEKVQPKEMVSDVVMKDAE